MKDVRFVPCLAALIAVLGLTGCGSSSSGYDPGHLDGVVLDSPSAVLFNTEKGTHLSVQFRDGSGASGFLSKRDAIEFTLRQDGWNGPQFTTYSIDLVERIVISNPQPPKIRGYR
jgi:hypothetical protein